MVAMGTQNSPPPVDLISTELTMGPVHEKETSTSVSARKKMPDSPLRSALRSLSLTSRLGSVSSNAPKNEAAKSMKTAKKSRLGSQCVASQLKMSAVTAPPPMRRVARISPATGSV